MTTEQKTKLIEIGQSIEPNFSISESDQNYYDQLFDYFMAVQDNKTNRGLFLNGELGTGKSLSIKLMKSAFGGFKIVMARHVLREFLQSKVSGMDILDIYGRNSYSNSSTTGYPDKKKPIHYCFDDVGAHESSSKMYGNQTNVFTEILSDRYEEWKEFGMRTIIVTNSDPDAIEAMYGKRIRDRLREMCVPIKILGESKRKAV